MKCRVKALLINAYSFPKSCIATHLVSMYQSCYQCKQLRQQQHPIRWPDLPQISALSRLISSHLIISPPSLLQLCHHTAHHHHHLYLINLCCNEPGQRPVTIFQLKVKYIWVINDINSTRQLGSTKTFGFFYQTRLWSLVSSSSCLGHLSELNFRLFWPVNINWCSWKFWITFHEDIYVLVGWVVVVEVYCYYNVKLQVKTLILENGILRDYMMPKIIYQDASTFHSIAKVFLCC